MILHNDTNPYYYRYKQLTCGLTLLCHITKEVLLDTYFLWKHSYQGTLKRKEFIHVYQEVIMILT